MFYESLIILNISTLNFSEGVPACVVSRENAIAEKIEMQLWKKNQPIVRTYHHQ